MSMKAFSFTIMLLAGAGVLHAQQPVSFSRDVLPILAANCFSCHGPDPSSRRSELRLDDRDSVLKQLSLNDPPDSELLRRVRSDDPEVVMPPPGNQRQRLTRSQADVLELWIRDQAPWTRHWAFEPPAQPQLPQEIWPTPDTGTNDPLQIQHTPIHPVDAFVLQRLSRTGLQPAPPAPRNTLARRLSFDLTGLPPRPEDVTAFESDPAPDAYESLVDRLLRSEHFGERMAIWWLDAARYADTDGFQGDADRTNWPWRDWVVSAFNANMPFDQFTIEQFAGDLLPECTPEQRLATAFHRNHMTNGEGGRDPEESRIDYVIDRVNTVGTVWLGVTLGCCQCHSHKYDPVSQADYYSVFAFFDSIDEDGKAGRGAGPYLNYESPFAERAVNEAQIHRDRLRQTEDKTRQAAKQPFLDWLRRQQAEWRNAPHPDAATGQPAVGIARSVWQPVTEGTLESTEGSVLTMEPDGTIQSSGPDPVQDDFRVIAPVSLPRVTGIRLEVLPHASHTRGSHSRGPGGYFILTDVKVQVRRQGSAQVREVAVSRAIADAADDPGKYEGYGSIQHVLDDDPRNGWSARDSGPLEPRIAILALTAPLQLDSDERLVVELRHRSTRGNASIGRFRVSLTQHAGPAVNSLGPAPLEQLAALDDPDPARLAPELRERLRDEFLADFSPLKQAIRNAETAQRQLDEATASRWVDVMVLAERSPARVTRILRRGVWDQKGDQVLPGVPAAIAPFPAEAPPDRLGLARWLVSRQNPLTARVLVNHIWQLLFGAGLVRTPDDFGVQGEAPTHPELLDWLAVDLMDHGWDLRRLIRTIVTSQTYRQSSAVTAELRERDPENRLLARGARFRLPSWMLRDAALQASGLLNPAIGGPPVRPYQPEGVWEEMFMGRFHYEPHEGVAQYRRTLYAFWRRAVAPTFLFDAAQRRVCEVRLPRTNTPLQALTMLNDLSYLESSLALAQRTFRQHSEPAGQITEIARRVLQRCPTPDELTVLLREYDAARSWYRLHPDEAAELLQSASRNLSYTDIPQNTVSEDPEPRARVASLLLVASLVLNLDEAMTHE